MRNEEEQEVIQNQEVNGKEESEEKEVGSVNIINKQDYNDGDGRGFKEGNPGRPKGSKNKTTLLKEKILTYCLDNIDLRLVGDSDVLKVGAGFVPKESKVEVSTPEPINIKIEHNYERGSKVQPEADQSMGDA